MPFAFVQYHERAHAEHALIRGRTTIIEGRLCRTEAAKVPRALYMTRLNGGSISLEEAREALRDCGPLSREWFPTLTDREMYRLAEGIWLEFAYFNDARDAQAAFRTHAEFRLEQPSLPPELRAQLQRAGRVSIKKTFRDNMGRLSLPKNPTALFVGNVPFNCEPDMIFDIFSQYGELRTIELVTRTGSVHCFVEYCTVQSADEALRATISVGGRRVRVEYRTTAPRSIPLLNPGNYYVGNKGMIASNWGIPGGHVYMRGYPDPADPSYQQALAQGYLAVPTLSSGPAVPMMPQPSVIGGANVFQHAPMGAHGFYPAVPGPNFNQNMGALFGPMPAFHPPPQLPQPSQLSQQHYSYM